MSHILPTPDAPVPELQYPGVAQPEHFHTIEVRDPRVLLTLQHAIAAAFADEKNTLRHVIRKIDARSDRIEFLRDEFENQLEKTLLTREVARIVGVQTGTSFRTLAKAVYALAPLKARYGSDEVDPIFEHVLELCSSQHQANYFRYEYYEEPVAFGNTATAHINNEMRRVISRMNAFLDHFEGLANRGNEDLAMLGNSAAEAIDVDVFGDYEDSDEARGEVKE
jgi:hypothetical protein